VVDAVAVRIRVDLERLTTRLVMFLEPAVRLFRERVNAYTFDGRMIFIEVAIAFAASALEP
jgi:hypothetical protein